MTFSSLIPSMPLNQEFPPRTVHPIKPKIGHTKQHLPLDKSNLKQLSPAYNQSLDQIASDVSRLEKTTAKLKLIARDIMATRYDLRATPAPRERHRRHSDANTSPQRLYPAYDHKHRSGSRYDDEPSSMPSRNQIPDSKRPRYDDQHQREASRSSRAPDLIEYRYVPPQTFDNYRTSQSSSSRRERPSNRRSSFPTSAKPQSVPRNEWNKPRKVELPSPNASKTSRPAEIDDISPWFSYGPVDEHDRRFSYPPQSMPVRRSRRLSQGEPPKKEKHVHWA